MTVGDGLFSLGVSVCIVSVLEGVGDGRSGTVGSRMTMATTPTFVVRHSGCITSAGVLPFPTHALGRDAIVQAVYAWGDPSGVSVRPLSGTEHEL